MLTNALEGEVTEDALPKAYECTLALNFLHLRCVQGTRHTQQIQLYGLNLLPDFFKSLSVQLSLTNDDKASED